MTYQNAHRSQYQAGASARTRAQGCTWTSGANGADAASGGAIDRTPDQVLALVAVAEETNPQTPGWSLGDLALAMRRLGEPFEIRSGRGWAAVTDALADGLYVVLQGDSDRFGDGSCSGAFDGDHAIGVHPERDAAGLQRIDDPICPAARYESRSTLRAYAEAFAPTVRFGVFTQPVPETEAFPMIPIKTDGPYDVTLDLGDQLYDQAFRPLVKMSAAKTVTGHFVTGTGFVGLTIVTRQQRQLAFAKVADVRLAPRRYPVTVGGKAAGTVVLP